MPCPEQAATIGLGKEKIRDNNLNPLSDIFLILGISPELMTFKSNPAENIPGLPVIIKEPLSVGT
jgi:hypothetical protein